MTGKVLEIVHELHKTPKEKTPRSIFFNQLTNIHSCLCHAVAVLSLAVQLAEKIM